MKKNIVLAAAALISALFLGSTMVQAENPNFKYLNDNKTKSGVKVTKTGLQYRVIKKGTGKSPKATDSVTVHYKGTLVNGKQFDSSYDRGTPATFGVGQVIPGWTQGLQLMKEGATYEFVIPSSLGYGTMGAGSDIPPGATLIFIVELLKVN